MHVNTNIFSYSTQVQSNRNITRYNHYTRRNGQKVTEQSYLFDVARYSSTFIAAQRVRDTEAGIPVFSREAEKKLKRA